MSKERRIKLSAGEFALFDCVFQEIRQVRPPNGPDGGLFALTFRLHSNPSAKIYIRLPKDELVEFTNDAKSAVDLLRSECPNE